jgi:hypothetical protein
MSKPFEVGDRVYHVNFRSRGIVLEVFSPLEEWVWVLWGEGGFPELSAHQVKYLRLDNPQPLR